MHYRYRSLINDRLGLYMIHIVRTLRRLYFLGRCSRGQDALKALREQEDLLDTDLVGVPVELL